MKAIIIDGCIACGLCEQICPEVFEMKDVAEVKPNADVDAHSDAAKEAADQCPVGVIQVLNS